MKRGLFVLLAAALLVIPVVVLTAADSSDPTTEASHKQALADMQAVGQVGKAEGLQAWQRIEAVLTHPRCANCHVGPDNIPLWTLAGEKTRPHDMNINAGVSRIGAETLPCSTCHMTSNAPNTVAHAPPNAGIPWQLAPVAFAWVGKTGAEICQQLRDPKSNSPDPEHGRDAVGLLEHLRHDAALDGFIPWAWKPGPGREAPPGTFELHVKDMATWGAAGQPCPNE